MVTPLVDPNERPASRRLAWLASDSDGNPVGSAYLLLHLNPSHAHLAELELAVHPSERRRGVGTRLLASAIAAAQERGVRDVVVDADVDSAGDRFLAARGLEIGLTLQFTRLALADFLPTAVEQVPGYRLVSWSGVVPEEWAQTFTEARAAMADAPVGAIDYGPDEWDLERTKSVAQVIVARGDHLRTIAVVDDGGRIVGFTELVVAGDGKGDGQHYGTAVLRAHRGRGLARWLKAEAIRQAREDHPDLAGLLTDMVDTNVAMRRVNEDLGYRITHLVRRYLAQISPASR